MSPERRQQVRVGEPLCVELNGGLTARRLCFRGQRQRVPAQPAVLPGLHRAVERVHDVLHGRVSHRRDARGPAAVSQLTLLC